MITSSYENNKLLKNITDFYLLQTGNLNLQEKFNIYISNNIMKDIRKFNKWRTSKILCDGATILPTSKNKKITILINDSISDIIKPQCIIHELCHMNDYVLFSNKYCEGSTFELRNNMYLSTVKAWSEFHVQLYVFPYYFCYFTYCDNTKNLYQDFISKIKTFYYNEFTKRFIAKQDKRLIDILYYLGQIVMCNLNDNETHYLIPDSIIDSYPIIEELLPILERCLTFDMFCENIDDLFECLEGLSVTTLF